MASISVEIFRHVLPNWMEEFFTSLACGSLVDHHDAAWQRSGKTVSRQWFTVLFDLNILWLFLVIVTAVLAVRVSKVVFVLGVFLLRDSQTHNSTDFLLRSLSGHKVNFSVQVGRERNFWGQFLAHNEAEGTQEQLHGASILIVGKFVLIKSLVNEHVTEF